MRRLLIAIFIVCLLTPICVSGCFPFNPYGDGRNN